MALGAQAKQVSWLISGAASSTGRRARVGAGWRAWRRTADASLLFQTGSADPITLVSISILLIVIAVTACLWRVAGDGSIP
jgi:hypothetical protein